MDEKLRVSDEIRFNQPPKTESAPKPQAGGKNIQLPPFFDFRKILKILALIVIFVALGYLAFLGKDFFAGKINNKVYSAVFLSNGQVYFGHITKNNNLEIVLNNVFYLQLDQNGEPAQEQLSQPKFTLAKLGNELHGPTDELFINRSQVVFYEKLRDNSKVVESIKNYKQ